MSTPQRSKGPRLSQDLARVTGRPLLPFACCLVAFGCGGFDISRTTMGDIEKGVAADTESMRQAENRTIAEILTKVPLSQQDQVRASFVEYFESTRGRRLAEPSSSASARPRRARVNARVQIVTVALVPQLPGANTKAVVIRRPGDEGKPILLLPASSVTDDELRLALRAAAEIAQKQGTDVSREFRYSIHDLSAGGPLTPRAPGKSSPLEDLRALPERALAGVGNVRSMELGVQRRPRTAPPGGNE